MEEDDNIYELIVSEGRLPIWRMILGGLFFTYMLYVLYYTCLIFYYGGFHLTTFVLLPKLTFGFCFSLAGGVAFATNKTIKIDVDENKLISIYSIGPFYKKIVSKVPELEYVAVFKNSKGEFETNLWYNRNKHYNMCTFYDKKPAMKLASYTAKKLNIDLLDATVKGNSEWIDKNKL